jgi:hypothetical protein
MDNGENSRRASHAYSGDHYDAQGPADQVRIAGEVLALSTSYPRRRSLIRRAMEHSPHAEY